MHDKIKKAVDISQRAQRNYDLSKTIPEKDLETLIYAASNAPSKQNETHFSLQVYTDQTIIREIYNTTKQFTLGDKTDEAEILDPNNSKNDQWMYKNRSVHNSQILSNALFVYIDDSGKRRCLTHMLAQHNDKDNIDIYNEQKNFSVGVSVGQLILSATLLGYKTGICSAFDLDTIKKVVNTENKVKLVIGIGYENIGIDRRLHAETLNREIPEGFRTGELDEQWRFPSLDKNMKVLINGKQQ